MTLKRIKQMANLYILSFLARLNEESFEEYFVYFEGLGSLHPHRSFWISQ